MVLSEHLTRDISGIIEEYAGFRKEKPIGETEKILSEIFSPCLSAGPVIINCGSYGQIIRLNQTNEPCHLFAHGGYEGITIGTSKSVLTNVDDVHALLKRMGVCRAKYIRLNSANVTLFHANVPRLDRVINYQGLIWRDYRDVDREYRSVGHYGKSVWRDV